MVHAREIGTAMQASHLYPLKAHQDSELTVWDVIKEADQDPLNTGNIVLLYTGDSVAKDAHSWGIKQIYSDGDIDIPSNSGVMTLDCHNLFAVLQESPDETMRSKIHSTSNWRNTTDISKGACARSILYMACVYS